MCFKCLKFLYKRKIKSVPITSISILLTPNHLLHERRSNLQGISSKEVSVGINSRYQHIKNFIKQWLNEVLLELRKSNAPNKIEEACDTRDVVLIQKYIALQINFRVDVSNGFIPSRDDIKEIDKVLILETHHKLDD